MNIAIAPYTYRDFLYVNKPEEDAEMPFAVLFEDKRLIRFADLKHLHRYVDDCIEIIEQVPRWKELMLHLTGCKRCQRTYQGTKTDPCTLGKMLFINGKQICGHVMTTVAAGIEEGRKVETPSHVE